MTTLAPSRPSIQGVGSTDPIVYNFPTVLFFKVELEIFELTWKGSIIQYNTLLVWKTKWKAKEGVSNSNKYFSIGGALIEIHNSN